MLQTVSPWEITNKIGEFKKFIWICHIKKKNKLVIRPSWDPLHEGIPTELQLLDEMYPEVVIFESFVEDSVDKILEFGVDFSEIRSNDFDQELRPIMMSFDKGWLKETSTGKCYCTETLMELIISIYPELFQEP
jgi:hypothetical protein